MRRVFGELDGARKKATNQAAYSRRRKYERIRANAFHPESLGKEMVAAVCQCVSASQPLSSMVSPSDLAAVDTVRARLRTGCGIWSRC
jgi:hypothetical protein